MIGDRDQSQKAGEGSTLIQAGGNVTVGVSATECRQMFLDLFEANALKLTGRAFELFEARARAFVDELLEEFFTRNSVGLASFEDPDMQHAIFTAQRDYARSGEGELETLLIGLLVQRSTAANLKRIVLNEAIGIASKLTDAQLDTMSLVLLLVHRPMFHYRFDSLSDFGEYLNQYFAPLIRVESIDAATYLHLRYTGCASSGLGGMGIPWRLRDAFPGCFTLGFERTQANSALQDLLIPCFHAPQMWQFRPIDRSSFISLCLDRGLDAGVIEQSEYIQRMQSIDVEPAWRMLTDLEPRMKILEAMHSGFEADIHPFVDIQLTSVGIALANANLRRHTGLEFYLGNWIK
jgi:hypothetical protein